MPFLPPNQQRQSTEGRSVALQQNSTLINYVWLALYLFKMSREKNYSLCLLKKQWSYQSARIFSLWLYQTHGPRCFLHIKLCFFRHDTTGLRAAEDNEDNPKNAGWNKSPRAQQGSLFLMHEILQQIGRRVPRQTQKTNYYIRLQKQYSLCSINATKEDTAYLTISITPARTFCATRACFTLATICSLWTTHWNITH